MTRTQYLALARATQSARPSRNMIDWELYDYQTYANAGQTSLTFFQIPVGGQLGGAARTMAETNMSANTLPAGQNFILTSLEFVFMSGAATDTFAATAAATSRQAADTNAFMRNGSARFYIGSMDYLQLAPLGAAPQSFGVTFETALASNSATTGLTKTEAASNRGKLFEFEYPIMINPSQNFGVTFTWPSAVALPSGVDGKVGVRLKGALIRNVQ
jgi:hypothetical protein